MPFAPLTITGLGQFCDSGLCDVCSYSLGSMLCPRTTCMKISYVFLFGVLLQTLGCGMSSPRTLQSVIASPATADAKEFPGGQVQFTATGIFTKPPTRVTPLPLCSGGATGACITTWSAFPPTVATIDQNGLAQCVPGQSQDAKINVALSGDGPLMTIAILTCP